MISTTNVKKRKASLGDAPPDSEAPPPPPPGGGIGVGQTIDMQQGLYTDVTIAFTGTLISMVVSGDSPNPLPDGLTLNASTGQITGVPTEYGNLDVGLTATFTDTVASGVVTLNIAQAFPVTFTFNQTPDPIPEGAYTSIYFDFTPDPNALPITWEVSGFPNGMWWYKDPSTQHTQLYGEPAEDGTFDITVTATNWAGVTTTTFPLTVYPYSMLISNASDPSFDGLYAPVAIGYYSGESPVEYTGLPYGWMWGYRLRIYQHESNPNYRLFYYENYGCWVLADVTALTMSPPLQTAVRLPNASGPALPPQDSAAWFPSLTCQWVAP
jgi:hypothetical protein